MSAADLKVNDFEFKLVVSRKGKLLPKSRSKLRTSFNRPQSCNEDRSEVCQQTVTTQLKTAEAELLQSGFFAECFENIQPILVDVEQIICLGLGNFSECPIARYQLAFIRCLRHKAHLKQQVQFYDPVFSRSEVDILHVLAETVLQDNVEGKYSAERKTLFYLPHCPKQIVNNLLWKNWRATQLTNLILLCNSFGTIVNNHPRRLLENNAGFIIRAASAFREVPLRNNFRFTDIFNDTSLHYLPSSDELGDSAWDYTEEPSYDADDLELIRKKLVEKLTFS